MPHRETFSPLFLSLWSQDRDPLQAYFADKVRHGFRNTGHGKRWLYEHPRLTTRRRCLSRGDLRIQGGDDQHGSRRMHGPAGVSAYTVRRYRASPAAVILWWPKQRLGRRTARYDAQDLICRSVQTKASALFIHSFNPWLVRLTHRSAGPTACPASRYSASRPRSRTPTAWLTSIASADPDGLGVPRRALISNQHQASFSSRGATRIGTLDCSFRKQHPASMRSVS